MVSEQHYLSNTSQTKVGLKSEVNLISCSINRIRKTFSIETSDKVEVGVDVGSGYANISRTSDQD